MTRTFSDGHPKVLPACNFLSQYYFYNIFLQKSCRFSLQTLTKFEAAKTGSGVGFSLLTTVGLCTLFVAQWSLSRTITASCMGQTIDLRRTGDELSDILFVSLSSSSSPEGSR